MPVIGVVSVAIMLEMDTRIVGIRAVVISVLACASPMLLKTHYNQMSTDEARNRFRKAINRTAMTLVLVWMVVATWNFGNAYAGDGSEVGDNPIASHGFLIVSMLAEAACGGAFFIGFKMLWSRHAKTGRLVPDPDYDTLDAKYRQEKDRREREVVSLGSVRARIVRLQAIVSNRRQAVETVFETARSAMSALSPPDTASGPKTGRPAR